MTPSSLPAVLAAHPEAARFCVLDTRPRDALRAQLDTDGAWWLGAGAGVASGPEVIGALLRPGHRPEAGVATGGVLVDNVAQMGALFVSDASRLVPMAIVRLRLLGDPAQWEDVRRRWPSVEASLTALDRALGGAGLADLVAVLADEGLRRAEADAADVGGRRAARRTMAARLDPDPRHLSFLEFLAALEADPWAPEPDDLGPWQTGAAARAYALRAPVDPWRPATLEAAWRFLRGPVTIDAGALDPLDPFAQPTEDTLVQRLTEAAGAVVLAIDAGYQGWDADPWARAVSAMARAGLAYTGLAHVETARDLDTAGRPEEAWDALISAALWTQVRTRTVVPAVRDAARMLAVAHGWDEIVREMG